MLADRVGPLRKGHHTIMISVNDFGSRRMACLAHRERVAHTVGLGVPLQWTNHAKVGEKVLSSCPLSRHPEAMPEGL